MYVKKNIKGFLEIDLEGSVGIFPNMKFSFEFFQSVHSIILKVNLSAGERRQQISRSEYSYQVRHRFFFYLVLIKS